MNKKNVSVISAKIPLEKMPIEEKIKLLNVIDKSFISGYIERALSEQQRSSVKSKAQ